MFTKKKNYRTFIYTALVITPVSYTHLMLYSPEKSVKSTTEFVKMVV